MCVYIIVYGNLENMVVGPTSYVFMGLFMVIEKIIMVVGPTSYMFIGMLIEKIW